MWVCDTYDWFQHHHTPCEVLGWFRAHGFRDVRRLRGDAARGRLYDRCQDRGLVPGSGVNVVGVRPG